MATKKTKQDDKAKALMSDGSVTLKADSRESIYQEAEQLVKQIPADTKWTRGCVEYIGGAFYQTYKLIKK